MRPDPAQRAATAWCAKLALTMYLGGCTLREVQTEVNARADAVSAQLRAAGVERRLARLSYCGPPEKTDHRLARRLVERGRALLGMPREVEALLRARMREERRRLQRAGLRGDALQERLASAFGALVVAITEAAPGRH